MLEKIVNTQAELDAIPVDFNGRIIIRFGTPFNRAVVNRKFKYSVVAWENSSVEAWGNSSVVAMGNSSVVAMGNSSVVAKNNVQVADRSGKSKIDVSGNARIVYDPRTVEEYAEAYDLEITDGKVKLYKAVHKSKSGEYYSDWHCDFFYEIGKMAKADSLTTDPEVDCGHGIHMAHKAWCINYGRSWPDLAILELEADASGVIVPLYGIGKVRAAKAKVLREVSLDECGLLGKLLVKQRKKEANHAEG